MVGGPQEHGSHSWSVYVSGVLGWEEGLQHEVGLRARTARDGLVAVVVWYDIVPAGILSSKGIMWPEGSDLLAPSGRDVLQQEYLSRGRLSKQGIPKQSTDAA